MKTPQLVLALVLLACVIFGLTFAKMYFTTTKPASAGDDETDGIGRPGAKLSFASTNFPPGLEDPLAAELYKNGHHDFWFENREKVDVLVGADFRSCKCSSILVFLLSNEWREQLKKYGLTPSGRDPDTGFVPSVLTANHESDLRKWLAQDAALSSQGLALLEEHSKGVKVPPGGFGFVRLTWDGRRQGEGAVQKRELKADLWHQHKGENRVTLFGRTVLVEPVRVDKLVMDGGVMGQGEDDERRLDFNVWSSTRSNFDVQFKIATEKGATESGRLIRIEKRPLTADEREAVADAAQIGDKMRIAVQSGYRASAHVSARSKDGKKRFPQGPFVRTITLTPVDENGKPIEIAAPGHQTQPVRIQLQVKGEVSGDFKVVSKTKQGRIDLGAFKQVIGKRHDAIISARQEGKSFTPAIEKVPFFLKNSVTLTAKTPKKDEWVLSLSVAPKLPGFGGVFPRNDPDYLDTAIYLKIELDGSTKKLRIPVQGIAIGDY